MAFSLKTFRVKGNKENYRQRKKLTGIDSRQIRDHQGVENKQITSVNTMEILECSYSRHMLEALKLQTRI